jgi:hypothetical protein
VETSESTATLNDYEQLPSNNKPKTNESISNLRNQLSTVLRLKSTNRIAHISEIQSSLDSIPSLIKVRKRKFVLGQEQ